MAILQIQCESCEVKADIKEIKYMGENFIFYVDKCSHCQGLSETPEENTDDD